MPARPSYRAILAVDAERFSSYPCAELPTVHDEIKRALACAFTGTGLDWEHADDSVTTGDGHVLSLGIEHIPVLVGPLVTALEQELRRSALDGGPRVRLRVAVHCGTVHLPQGVSQAKNDTCRMLELAQLRYALAHSDAFAALAVSDRVYQAVVQEGYATDLRREWFAPVQGQVKDFHERAWLYVPGYEQPPLPSQPAVGTEPAAQGRAARAQDGPTLHVGHIGSVGNLVTGVVHQGLHTVAGEPATPERSFVPATLGALGTFDELSGPVGAARREQGLHEVTSR